MDYYKKYYSNYGNHTVQEYVDIHLRNSPLEQERLESLVNIVPDDVTTLLDVGAGHGLFLEKLQSLKHIKAEGIEITQEKVDYGHSIGVKMQIGDASSLPYLDNSFDAVVCFEVLEHLPYEIYEKALSEIQRVAKRYIIIGVPHNEKRVFVTCPYCSSSINPSLHLRSFFDHAMTKLFPEWSLTTMQKIGSYQQSIIHFLPFKRSAPWPSYLVCPACGYHQIATISSKEKSTIPILTFKTILKRLLPSFEMKRWSVALYTKED